MSIRRIAAGVLAAAAAAAVGVGVTAAPANALPKDCATRRVENYAELRKPGDPHDFIAELKAEMRAELDALNTALPKLQQMADDVARALMSSWRAVRSRKRP
ncbi:hypothetical protein ACTWPT_27820 [Nonomuraea sp. 3N208]|uniref:hypothetical protein n=1 Tax=Nonomuraea sp. 3N208 TaxID=3457421 RepID=UPI003FD56097